MGHPCSMLLYSYCNVSILTSLTVRTSIFTLWRLLISYYSYFILMYFIRLYLVYHAVVTSVVHTHCRCGVCFLVCWFLSFMESVAVLSHTQYKGSKCKCNSITAKQQLVVIKCKRLGGPQSQFEHCGENSWLYTENGTLTPRSSSQ
jgi:hypothetical protein